MIKKFIKSSMNSLRNITIRKKLLISYFLLILVPLVLMTVFTYKNVSENYEAQIIYSAGQSFDQAHTFLNYKVNAVINASDTIYFNTEIAEILKRQKSEYDIGRQNLDRLNMEAFLNSFYNAEDVYRATLYVPGWFNYSDQDIYFSNIDTFSDTEEYSQLMDSNEKVLWIAPETIKNYNNSLDPVSVISMFRKIRDSEQISSIIGIIRISILEEDIKGIISKANITRDGIVYIQNSKGVLISCSSEEKLENLQIAGSINNEFKDSDSQWNTVTIAKNNFYVNSRDIASTDWKLLTVIPYSEILSQSNKIKNLMIVIMIIIIIISYALSWLISKSSVKRIINLMNKMKHVQEGNLNVKIESKSGDEIGRLTDSFNYMVKRIRILVEEQYQNGKEIKNLELKALQAQINPHFLYNTLETINWKAIDNGVPEISEITQALARFYKLSLNKGKDIVRIEDEINHIKTYVQIQNMRFDNKINLVIDIDREIYNYKILKLILQPVVENSIYHGILENKESQKGTITIGGRFDGGDIILTVRDDGVGMEEKKAMEILKEESTDEHHGYGVRNIHHRITLIYGTQYGLLYRSSSGKGTTVKIKIPAEPF